MVTVPRVVGVCTLTTRELARELSGAPGVAIAGPLMTANLGIEELVRTVLRHRNIAVLLVCGRDSALFRSGQSLIALVRNGIQGANHRIAGAAGHLPFLPGLRPSDVDAFRSRVRLVDRREVLDAEALRGEIAELARDAGGAGEITRIPPAAPEFAELRPGGRRRPIASAGEGFFVISVTGGEVVLRHYRKDFSAGHEMRGRRAESMVLGVLRAGLVADPAHAAYLGAELAKAETALRLGLEYVQDIPLRGGRREDTMEEFLNYLAGLLDAGITLAPNVPLGEQLAVDSSRMIELAIALEQECGVDLPDDLDLRRATPAELFQSAQAFREAS
jgi:acyl carrier protein